MMKAIVQTRYGSPDVLQFRDVAEPAVGDDEVLVRVHAAAVNIGDWHLLRGVPYVIRLVAGLRRPRREIPGLDIAGQVEAVGRNVGQFRPGDEVFGWCKGAFAEYACAAETDLLPKPANLTSEQSAAVGDSALTALAAVRDQGKVQPGDKVVINGASGGVGTFAVQIAKSFGANVTGVCSTRNLDLVRSIGADHVIDYAKEDFTRNGQLYDLIYDAVGNRSVSDYKRALRPEGTRVIAGFTTLSRLFGHAVLGPLESKIGNKKVGLMGLAKINRGDLVFVKELLEA